MAHLTLLCFGSPKAGKQQKSAAPPTTITTEGNDMKRLINGLPETYVEVSTMFADLLNTLTLKGYYLVPNNHDTIPYATLCKIMRWCAKEMGRPFVKISIHKSYAWISFPRRKYLSPIANVLSLVESKQRDAPVCGYHEISNWRFKFNDMTLFNEFLEQLHTRPEFRKALKLPEKVTT